MRTTTLAPILAACALTVIPFAPSHALDLSGTTWAKEQVIVYIFIGHSNMVGRRIDTETHPRAWNYHIPDLTSRPEGWCLAEGPIHTFEKLNAGPLPAPQHRIGPAIPFLRSYLNHTSGLHMVDEHPDHVIAAIQNADSALYVRDDYLPGKSYYNDVVNRAKLINGSVTFGGIVCMLGYMEAGSSTKAGAFAQDCKTMVEGIRGELGLPNLPFLIGEYEITAPNKGGSYWTTVRDQINSIPGLIPHSAVVDAGITSSDYYDDHHYNDSGYYKWANRAIQVIQQNGWFPDTPVPSNDPPVADAGPDQTAAAGDTVTLDASGSSDPDGDALSLTWTNNSGIPTPTFSDIHAVHPTVTIPDLSPGTVIEYGLSVTDGNGGGDMDAMVITVSGTTPPPNSPPVADAGTDQTAAVGDTITLDASGSSDPDGDALSLTWTNNSGIPTPTFSDIHAVHPTVTIPDLSDGTVIVYGLTVTDGNGGSDADTMTVTVVASGDDAPAAPSGLDAAALDAERVELTWDLNTDDAVAYNLYRDTSGGVATTAANRVGTGVTFPPFTDFGVAADTTYHYVATALDADGNESSPSAEAVVTTPAYVAPAITVDSPAGGEVWYVGTTQRIRWTAQAVDDVTVLYSIDGGSTWVTIASSIRDDHPEWGDMPWLVPDEPSTECLVVVADYFGITSAQSAATFEVRVPADADLDGMDDDWEILHFGDTSRDGSGDADGDAVTDLDEFLGGTDPWAADLPVPAEATVAFSCVAGAGAADVMWALAAALGWAWLASTRRGAHRDG